MTNDQNDHNKIKFMKILKSWENIREPQWKYRTFATSMNEAEKSAVKDKNCEH